MKQTGTVSALRGNLAEVAVIRASMCEGCHQKAEGCAACSLLGGERVHKTLVGNSLGAKVGDCVEIEAADRTVLLLCALVFLLPVAVAIAFYFLGASLFADNQTAPYVFALLGLLLSFCAVGVVSHVLSRRRPIAEITSIFTSMKGETPNAE